MEYRIYLWKDGLGVDRKWAGLNKYLCSLESHRMDTRKSSSCHIPPGIY